MSRSTAAILVLICTSTGAWADSAVLTPERLAAIQHEEQEALAKVAKAHGDKPPAQMDREERRVFLREQQQAQQAVLQKHKVNPKDFARASSTLSRDERATLAEEERRLAAEAEKAG